ncbi:MAG: HDOD domain-containing protein [Candidatus Rokubacteria bacterium]|nr:HDOD domain-containing protein [Candidatus Rokubacteria bacterium]
MSTRVRPVIADLKRLSKLPPLSPVVAQLTATLSGDDVDFRDLERIIRRDPVITARVIGAANAAAYAGHAPTTSIHASVMRLGVLAVRRLAFLLSLYNAVPVEPAERKAFWRHSLAVAYAADVVTRHVPTWSAGTQMEQAFLAALLHDLGLLALGRHYPKENEMVMARVAEDRVARSHVEREIFGVDHAEIGARLAMHWAFPKTITPVIACHHDFASAPEEAQWLSAVVALADALCNEDETSAMGEGSRVGTIEEAIALLGLAPDALAQIVDQTRADSARDLLVLETIGGY